MFRLAHLSDVHLGPLPDVAYRELISKRAVGYINWQRNRRFLLHDNVVDALVADIKAAAPDHIAVTGDLVNLALDRELELARLWLDSLGEGDDVSVVPGNHDAYVPGAFDKICRAWAPFMSGDGANHTPSRSGFPYLRVRAKVALIGVTTAYATAPFMANGFFRERQGDRLAAMLAATRERGLFRLIMMHHPPVRDAVSQHKRLFGIGRFQSVVAREGADLVIHGHSHIPSRFSIAGRDGQVPVIGVSAGGQAPGGDKPAAQYNLFEIDGESGNWSVELTRRGLTGRSLPPATISTETLSEPGVKREALRS
jgi:3',5'-cyclic AMP phosphodiesterase CpdA